MEKMIQILMEKGYKVLTRPYELNLVGVRSQEGMRDELHVFYKLPTGNWNYHVFTFKTDQGTHLKDSSVPLLKAGQYMDVYSLSDDERALVQVKPVTVIQHYRRGALLDFFNGKEETGLFSIGICKE